MRGALECTPQLQQTWLLLQNFTIENLNSASALLMTAGLECVSAELANTDKLKAYLQSLIAMVRVARLCQASAADAGVTLSSCAALLHQSWSELVTTAENAGFAALMTACGARDLPDTADMSPIAAATVTLPSSLDSHHVTAEHADHNSQSAQDLVSQQQQQQQQQQPQQQQQQQLCAVTLQPISAYRDHMAIETRDFGFHSGGSEKAIAAEQMAVVAYVVPCANLFLRVNPELPRKVYTCAA